MSIQLWGLCLERELTEVETRLLWEHLPRERRKRLQRQERAQWAEPLCAYGLLHLALWESFHWREIPEFHYGELGKPSLAEWPEVYFSISHTRKAVLVGLSDKPLGVDVERERPLSPRIQERLDREGTSTEGYFRSWVRYEAAVKLRGGGVTPHHDPQEGEKSVSLTDFPGCFAAYCGEGELKSWKQLTLEQLLHALSNIL